MGFLRKIVSGYTRSRAGNFAITAAVITPVLLGAIAGSVDLIKYSQKKSKMQEAADSAALAAVNEANLKGWSQDIAQAVAQTFVDNNFHEDPQNVYRVTATVDSGTREVHVALIQDHYPYFLSGFMPSPQITVSAKAVAAGSTNVCVIALDTAASEAVGLNDGSKLQAPDCAVYSNSTATDGLASNKNAVLNSDLACSSGGYVGSASNYQGSQPLADCPAIDNPLATRAAPSFGSCDQNDLVLKDTGAVQTIYPGVYCGGLEITDQAKVDMKPGVYVMKDGDFLAKANSVITGKGVGIFFTGKNATFALESGTEVSFEAPTTGPLAGLILFQDPASDEAEFRIKSKKSSVLLGTIYLPNGNFVIDTNSQVAEASAYTAIVAKTVTLLKKPVVVLNTNYSATAVPVPDGIKGSSGTPRLVR